MNLWLQAGLWGLVAGSALVLGATIAWFVKVPQRVVGSVMAFGAGVLISALAFDLVEEAADSGGLPPTALGFLGGSVAYVAANMILARFGARHRKRSSGRPTTAPAQVGSGTAIAIGALLDGVPESVALGVSLFEGAGISIGVLVAIFLSNLPEGLSSSAGMKKSGRSAKYVFGVWGGIAVASGVAAALGVLLLAGASPELIAVITAVAAGAIIAMVADTMLPEAFETTHLFSGLIASVGFLLAFTISSLT